VSPSQMARVLTQGWVEREAYCLRCGFDRLAPTPQNTRALDFRCGSCAEPYELKSSKRPFRKRVLDGEYSTFIHALESHDNPNLLLLSYDPSWSNVTDLVGIPRQALSRLTIIPRAPLSANARREGWQGCSIDLTGLPQSALIPIVTTGTPRSPSVVLRDWRQYDFITRSGRVARDWLPDVIACVNRIAAEEFDLLAVYDFESELRILHPRNYNVKPKIRQQLQILIRNGLVTRVRPGVYRKTALLR
jgi:type II restriction enzyme